MTATMKVGEMKVGDTVKATWSDGLVMIGRYVGTERGYIILQNEASKIVCSPTSVTFEVVNEVSCLS
jgi:predicted nucleic acid-binding Zn finger protein